MLHHRLLVVFGAVKHQQYEIGFAEQPACPAYPLLFDQVDGVTQSGRIVESHRDAVQDCLGFDEIPCRTMYIGDDRAVLLEQQVEQGRLAGIGGTGQDDPGSLTIQFADLVGPEECADAPLGFFHQGGREIDIAGNLILGVIELHFHHTQRMQDLLLDLLDQREQVPLQPTQSQRVGQFRLRGDYLHDRFGPCEVHFPMHERTECEFSR